MLPPLVAPECKILTGALAFEVLSRNVNQVIKVTIVTMHMVSEIFPINGSDVHHGRWG